MLPLRLPNIFLEFLLLDVVVPLLCFPRLLLFCRFLVIGASGQCHLLLLPLTSRAISWVLVVPMLAVRTQEAPIPHPFLTSQFTETLQTFLLKLLPMLLL